MATEYLKNGDFSDDLAYWDAPANFQPDFKPMEGGPGQSIKLKTGVTVSQSMTEFPSHKLHFEFDVHNAELSGEVLFVVVVGGYNQEGTMNVTQVVSLATQEWVHYSGDFDFQEKLKNCFLTLSAPADTSSFSRSGVKKASEFGPVRFANFSLTLAD